MANSTDLARPQTALQGVASATALNLLARGLNFARQVAITAWFGLSLPLDAFYVAVAIAGLFINSFGDVFDSAGIPALVRTRAREGDEAFQRLTGSLFAGAVMLGVGLTILMILAAPLARFLVPGFSADSLGLVRGNLWVLVPFALLYLPYHCVGSFFRSRRDFRIFYVGELVVMACGLVTVVLGRASIHAVPLAFSVGYSAGFALFVFRARGRFRFWGTLGGEAMAGVRRVVWRMLPVYGLAHGAVIVEKYFGSFLEAGAISALAYGAILASTIPAVMNVENVFVTPLAEDSDRGELLTRILSGVSLVAVPTLAFLMVFSDDLVRALFQRGAFTLRASQLTAEALRAYAVGIPGLFLLPVCVRTLQVTSVLRWVAGMGALGLLFNVAINLLFIAAGHRGVQGVALAAGLSTTAVAVVGFWSLSRVGVHVRYRETLGLLPGVLGATAMALALALILRPPWHPLAALAACGTVFGLGYVVLAWWLPGAEMARVRAMIVESFPWLRHVASRRR